MESNTKKAAKTQTQSKVKPDGPVKFVSPGESGKGFPYAPIDWPNPGDIWSWKVGKRIRHDGVYKDRFLNGPERLQEKPTKQLSFASKVSVQRYIELNFPGSDVDAFFASFIWDIPAELTPSKESNANTPLKVTPLSQIPPSHENETTNYENGGTSMAAEEATPKRKSRASNAVYVEDEEKEPPTKKSGVKTPKKTPKSKGKQKIPVSTTKRAVAPPGYDETRTPIKCKAEIQDLFDDSQAGLTHEEFDGYVNSLDEMLSSPFLRAESSFDVENITMKEAREKLSSLLAMGFPNLALSNKLNELNALSNKLRNDPNLNSTELSILDLIQEIPPFCNRFQEAKGISVQAAKFFSDLESKTASITELRSEYSSSKDDIGVLQAEEASVIADISELEQQIATLQARRQEMTQTIKATNKNIVHFTSVQKRVMVNLPKIVREIQIANSDKQEWDAKKKITAEHVSKILDRFSPLEGFSF